MILGYKGGLVMKNPFSPTFWMLILHFFLIRPLGYGSITDLQGDIFYPLAFVVFAIIGTLQSWAMGLKGAGRVAPGEFCANYWMRILWKVLLLFIGLSAGAIMAFEYIPHTLWYVGFPLTLIFLLLADLLFWVMFRDWKVQVVYTHVGDFDRPETFIPMWFYDLIYYTVPVGVKCCLGGHKWRSAVSEDITKCKMNQASLLAMIIYMVSDVVITCVFCLVWMLTGHSQFYLACYLAGAMLLMFVVTLIAMWKATTKKEMIRDLNKIPKESLNSATKQQ